MASSGLPDRISEQAAQWAVDAAYGEMTPESQAALDAWLAEDTRHRGAYARACASLYMLEDTVTEKRPARVSHNDNSADTFDTPKRRFRWAVPMVAGSAALAASVALFLAIGVPIFPSSKQAPSYEVQTLEDGSVATLEPGTRIYFATSDRTRKVTLLTGKATFKVAKDKEHPFVVQSGSVYAQATGTVYAVSRFGRSGGSVKVTEGSVLVWQHDDRDQAVLLRAGDSVTLDPVPRKPAPVAKRSPAPEVSLPPDLAQISLDDVPIKDAALRFNRVNQTKIEIEDPAIGKATIVGLYPANAPEQFAQAAAIVTGGVVENREGSIVIKKK